MLCVLVAGDWRDLILANLFTFYFDRISHSTSSFLRCPLRSLLLQILA